MRDKKNGDHGVQDAFLIFVDPFVAAVDTFICRYSSRSV
jgi:thymidine phosphorylase